MTDATHPLDPLRDGTLFVRPPAERTPAMLVGTAAGDVHADLVRWHDGPQHRRHRQRVERFIDTLSAEQLGDQALSAAAIAGDPQSAAYDVPLAVMARAVGVAAGSVERAVALARSAARGMGPGATGDPSEAIDVMPELLSLVPGDEVLDAANRIGLLLQTCDAVAGLVRASTTRTGHSEHVVDIDEAQHVVAGALADDPPVRVARRFRADGELVTVDIGDRPFGAGVHRCPGEALAMALAAGTVAGLSVAARGEWADRHDPPGRS